MDYRKLMIPLGVGLAGVAGVALFWSAIHSSVRWALWAAIMLRPASSDELRKLDECQELGWWSWLKVLAQDLDVPCGEAWLVDTAAQKLQGGGDREEWVVQWLTAPESGPRLRLRASLLLAAAGLQTPIEPAWLITDPGLRDRGGEWVIRATAEERSWTVHLGPRWTALGTAEALATEGLDLRDAVAPLEALALVHDEDTHRRAARAVAEALGVPPDLPDDMRYRRVRGLPVGDLPEGWARTILQRRDCDAPCLPLWVDLMELETAAAEGEPWEDPEPTAVLRPFAELRGYTGAEARALEWWVRATTRWVASATDPRARLASLGEGGGGGRGDPVAVLWDRSGAPMTTALVVSEVGRRTGHPVEVRVDLAGAVWMDVAGLDVVRPPCGGAAGVKPADEPWPWEALVAAALAEAAADAASDGSPAEALRLATAAERLDPLGAGGASLRVTGPTQVAADAEVGRAVGAALLRPVEPPAGGEVGRVASSARAGAPRCR